ncbi:hypothetical protein RJT34_22788 [Clitoria ternatea]|uniref:Uncharacterized protein n=1 Tax=Clitoria ternatea TaxID=43366 RepID=A0AAN9FMW9_CLITE
MEQKQRAASLKSWLGVVLLPEGLHFTMKMSAYENIVGGKLKLKGLALDVAGGVKKKAMRKLIGARLTIQAGCEEHWD